MQQAKATKTLVFQFDHVNPRIHVSVGLVPPPRTLKVQVEIPYEKNKNPAGDCYPRINNYIISICFKFGNPRCSTTKIGRFFLLIGLSNRWPRSDRKKCLTTLVFLFWNHLGVSSNGGTQQPWVFLLKMIMFGVFWGYHYFWKHPSRWVKMIVNFKHHHLVFHFQFIPMKQVNLQYSQ